MNAVSNGTAILCFNAGAGGTLPSAYSVCTTGFATASTWTFYGAPPWALTAGAIGDVISTPTNNAFLLAAGGGSTNSSGAATLWRSTNNGTSWTPIITSSLLAMGLFVIGTKIYVWGRSYQTGTNSAYAYSIYVSNDDGLTFNPVSNPSTYNINPSGFFQISSSVSIYPYGGFVYHSGSGNVLTLTNFSAAAATLVYNAPEWTDSTNVWLDNVPNQYVRVA
jgi:hypothetical protein